jgi:hypothetical protein
MKLGIALGFLDFRNDFRRVIGELCREHEVVLLLPADQAEAMRALVPMGVEVRIISERSPSLNRRLWQRLFSRFGQIPKSIGNYYLMERFLILQRPAGLRRRCELLAFDLSLRLPKWLSYDIYLDHLPFTGDTQIDDIDRFLLLTRIADDALLARLIHEDRDVQVYVYSWDHPCKHRQFSRRVDYLVWSDSIGRDLVDLQSVPSSRVKSIGSSQLCYLHEILQQDMGESPYDYPYVYLGCFAGIREMTLQEVEIILRISRTMAEAAPDVRLVVRPYPILRDWSLYAPLEAARNIVMDDDFRRQDLSTSEDKIQDKLRKIHHAVAFLHLGTTMGLEACFTATPSFIVDYGYSTSAGRLSIEHGIHQYQNEKYLINGVPSNVLRSDEDLQRMLAAPQAPVYLGVNERVQSTFGLTSFKDFARRLVC